VATPLRATRRVLRNPGNAEPQLGCTLSACRIEALCPDRQEPKNRLLLRRLCLLKRFRTRPVVFTVLRVLLGIGSWFLNLFSNEPIEEPQARVAVAETQAPPEVEPTVPEESANPAIDQPSAHVSSPKVETIQSFRHRSPLDGFFPKSEQALMNLSESQAIQLRSELEELWSHHRSSASQYLDLVVAEGTRRVLELSVPPAVREQKKDEIAQTVGRYTEGLSEVDRAKIASIAATTRHFLHLNFPKVIFDLDFDQPTVSESHAVVFVTRIPVDDQNLSAGAPHYRSGWCRAAAYLRRCCRLAPLRFGPVEQK